MCTKCKAKKDIKLFPVNNRDYVLGSCKKCRSEYNKKWVSKNKEQHTKVKKKYYMDNHEILKEKRILKSEQFKAYYNEWQKNKYHSDEEFKLKHRLRSRLYRALNGKIKLSSAVSNLGCSVKELKKHLETQFQLGMTWENWTIDGWHVDHIKPLSAFDLTDPKQVKEACHYTNLQPMWASENLSKGGETCR